MNIIKIIIDKVKDVIEIEEVLRRIELGEITPKEAYKMLYKKKGIRRAWFFKLKMITDRRGLNIFLRIIFFFPIPFFIAKFILVRSLPVDERKSLKGLKLYNNFEVKMNTEENIKINVKAF